MIATTVYLIFRASEIQSPLKQIMLAILFGFIANGYDFSGILRHRGMKILGDISYSIYLTHGMIMYLMFVYTQWFNFKNNSFIEYVLLCFPLTFICVIAFSFCTYFLIERPFLQRHLTLPDKK